jgi:glycosyltransferase involved in cell wall biosynthesis
MDKKTFSIIMPVFNEEQAIAKVIKDLRGTFPDIEIIAVNDGSTDATGKILDELPVTAIHHPHNKGYGASLKTGIDIATNDNLIFYDGDGQHKVGEIPLLLEKIEPYDMVVGARTISRHRPLLRRPGMFILIRISQILTGRKIPDLNSGFRAVKRNLIKKYLHLLPQGFSASTTMTLIFMSRGYNVTYVPIKGEKRVGKSTVSPLKDGFNTILLILRLIALVNPLKIFLPSSIALFIIGILWSIPYLLKGHGLTVASLFLLSTSIIIFFIGILADQISQLRLEKYE